MRNDIVNNVRLDVNREKNKAVIYVRVGDTKSRTIHFTIVDKGTVVNLDDVMIALITIVKPDGNHCYNDMVRQWNELHYTLTPQSINVPGECSCSIELTYKDGATIAIAGFSIMVYEKYLSDKYLESINEYKGITAQVVLAKQFADAAAESEEKCADYENSTENNKDAVELTLENIKLIQNECKQIESKCNELYERLQSASLLELGTGNKNAFYGDLGQIAYIHSQYSGNPHGTTCNDIGAEVVGAAQAAYENAVAYTDQMYAKLVNGAPTTLDTIGEIAEAFENNADVVEALDAAIGSKANAEEVESLISKLDERISKLEDMIGYPIG